MCCLSQVSNAQFYWVGDGGNWSDFASHSATTSGGSSLNTSTPTVTDDVFFDANSFSAGSQTVTIDVAAFAANLDFTGVTNSPTLYDAAAEAVTIGNDLTFVSGMSLGLTGVWTFMNASDVNIELGDAAKTILELVFLNATGNSIINTGEVANLTDRNTFGDITLSSNGADLTEEDNLGG